jgi:hypothetical protein
MSRKLPCSLVPSFSLCVLSRCSRSPCITAPFPADLRGSGSIGRGRKRFIQECLRSPTHRQPTRWTILFVTSSGKLPGQHGNAGVKHKPLVAIDASLRLIGPIPSQQRHGCREANPEEEHGQQHAHEGGRDEGGRSEDAKVPVQVPPTACRPRRPGPTSPGVRHGPPGDSLGLRSRALPL